MKIKFNKIIINLNIMKINKLIYLKEVVHNNLIMYQHKINNIVKLNQKLVQKIMKNKYHNNYHLNNNKNKK